MKIKMEMKDEMQDARGCEEVNRNDFQKKNKKKKNEEQK